MLGAAAPEEVVRVYILAPWQSGLGSDHVIGNDHCQSRFTFLGREAESIAMNPRFRTHKGITDAQPRPPHQLYDRSHLRSKLIGGPTRMLVIVVRCGNHLFKAATEQRPTYATTCLRRGADVKMVQGWLGHSGKDFSSTSRYLAAAEREDDQAKAASIWGDSREVKVYVDPLEGLDE
jgi:hypothetical protein